MRQGQVTQSRMRTWTWTSPGEICGCAFPTGTGTFACHVKVFTQKDGIGETTSRNLSEKVFLKLFPQMFCFGEQFGSNRKLRAIKGCLEQQLVRESTAWTVPQVTLKRQTVQFLHSEALPNQGWSNPNSSQRDVESGEKSHCGVECFSGDEQLQEQPMNSWVSQIPRLGFLPTAASPGCPGSCRAAFQGKQLPVRALAAPGEAQNSFLRGVSPSSSPGHLPCALNSSRGGFFSGINSLNLSAVLKNTGGWEEDLLEWGISSAKCDS